MERRKILCNFCADDVIKLRELRHNNDANPTFASQERERQMAKQQGHDKQNTQTRTSDRKGNK
jgi:hypothetical protein